MLLFTLILPWRANVVWHNLYYFSVEMDKFEEKFLEGIKKIRWGSKRPDTGSIFKLLTMDTTTNITMKETKKKQALIRDLDYRK